MGNRRKKAAKNILFGCAFGLSIMILMLGAGAAAGEVAADVEKILREVRQDQPVPAVKRVIGSPRAGNPDKSEYSWEWPDYRTGSLHYAKGTGPGEGFTVVSLFYR